MLNNEVLYSINTVIFEGCGRNRNMNIECQLFRFKLTIPQPASTELQSSVLLCYFYKNWVFCTFSFSFLGVLFSPHFIDFALWERGFFTIHLLIFWVSSLQPAFLLLTLGPSVSISVPVVWMSKHISSQIVLAE